MNTTTTSAAQESGRALYHSIWQTVKDRFYDPSRITNWDQWEHRFDDAIDNVETAQRFAREMVAGLRDKYSKVLDAVQVEQKDEIAAIDSGSVAAVELPQNIGYICIGTFGQLNIFTQLKIELEKVKHCDGFIIDLRDNGGGFVSPAANCLEFFIPEGHITTLESKMADGVGKNDIFFSEDTYLRLTTNPDGSVTSTPAHRVACVTAGKPIVLLIDGGTASASEMFAAALLEMGKKDDMCIAVGGRTFGKGIVQDTIDFDTCSLTLTSGRYLSPTEEWFGDGAQTVANGIRPHISVRNPSSKAALTAGFEFLMRKLGRELPVRRTQPSNTGSNLAWTAAAALIGIGFLALAPRRA